MRPDVSVIIVNWNTRDLLERCLATLFECTSAAVRVETIVVDNASTDASAEMVASRFPGVRLVANSDNAGFARGNNQVLELCAGRYVYLLNPDTETRPGALEKLVDYMDAHPEAGAAGARLLNLDNSLQTSCYRAPTLSRELWRLLHLDVVYPYGSYHQEDWDLTQPREVDVVQGAALIVRREIVERHGLFDEDYYIYSEEVDFCRRLRELGWRIVWVPEAQVVHYGGQSTRQVPAAMFLRLYQGKVLYFRKHHGPASTLLYKWVLAATALLRLALAPLTWLEPPARRESHRQLAGYYASLLRALPAF